MGVDDAVGHPALGPGALQVLDEATVVARARDGNVQAFELLLDRYQAPLFR